MPDIAGRLIFVRPQTGKPGPRKQREAVAPPGPPVHPCWGCPVPACLGVASAPDSLCPDCTGAGMFIRARAGAQSRPPLTEAEAQQRAIEKFRRSAPKPVPRERPQRYRDPDVDFRPIRNGLPFRPYVYRGTGEDILTGHLADAELEMAGAQ